ncbi:hypothetical protein VIGAN_01273600 [Vigna angularis var. angularis]|uniref:Uncharacterized protein n=1 Tax=Vigna angularis var. angularis TaxID=157739 RepID=A0A0S3R331_PHAAN|nr:hypothetical protein VIGAN_01273600 [Vigna angularis var. angularis]
MMRKRKGPVRMQTWWTNTIKQNGQKHWCRNIKKRWLTNPRKITEQVEKHCHSKTIILIQGILQWLGIQLL